MKTGRQFQTLVDYHDQHVSADSDPYWRFERREADTLQCLGLQLLFEPLQQKFDLLRLYVKHGDHLKASGRSIE